MTLKEIANIVNGKIIGDETVIVKTLSPIEFPESQTLLYVENEKLLDKALKSDASALLIPESIPPPDTNKGVITVSNGKRAFIKLLSYFENIENNLQNSGIDPSVIIGNRISIGENVTIYPGCILMDNISIGDNVTIYPNTTIYHDVQVGSGTKIHANVVLNKGTILGENNIIYSGVVIGSDGFGYHDDGNIRYKIPQIGIAETGDHVEVGSNSTIDRGTLGKTFIGSGTKIDNLVQIAHNCIIGKNCYIAAQAGIAGSCRIGNNVMLAGQVGIADHIEIGDNVVVLGQSGVTKSIKSGEVVMGFPAKPVKETRRILAAISRLGKKRSPG